MQRSERLSISTVSSVVHVRAQSRRSRLCDAMDRGPPGSSVRGILQARTLQRAAVSLPIRAVIMIAISCAVPCGLFVSLPVAYLCYMW